MAAHDRTRLTGWLSALLREALRRRRSGWTRFSDVATILLRRDFSLKSLIRI
jgi:hypothetical protein